MDFSTEFVSAARPAARDTGQGVPHADQCRGRGPHGGALLLVYHQERAQDPRSDADGGVGHAHEYRLLFAVPKLGADELADWWAYAEKAFETLVEPDENHDFSIVSVILAAGELEKDVPKRLKKLAHEQQFEGGKHGWGSVRMACVDLEAHKLCVSRMGDSLKNIMKAAL